jgi:hypothetical protein
VKPIVGWGTLALAVPPTLFAYAALLGLGMHRHAAAWATSLTATTLVFGPPMALAAASQRNRMVRLGLGQTLWALMVVVGMPVYFPGERRVAVTTGVAVMGLGQLDGLARRVADSLPDEPAVARPSVPVAASVMTQLAPPPLRALGDGEIALPYDGEGRRMSVPVVFDHGDQSLEVYMMLDTGATYTTLPVSVLRELGVPVDEDAPSIVLHTANGTREARIGLLDKVWLGDLALRGVAVATCDNCSSSDTVGLLGLNVAGGFNVNIDADRREVVFSARKAFDRHLDVKPFSDLGATFQRFPGGRVEVSVTLANTAPMPISSAEASVRCKEQRWLVELASITPGQEVEVRRVLPQHDPCDTYEIALDSAHW